MSSRLFPSLCGAIPILLVAGLAWAQPPAKSNVGLTRTNVSKLARKTGKWVLLATFVDDGKKRHLLCRHNKKAKRAGCVIAGANGKLVQKRITIAPTKDGRALAFRLGSAARDKWLRVPLQPSVVWETGGSGSPQTHNGSLEGAFGADFSNVSVHPGGEAVTASIGARAFTSGEHISFGRKSETAPKQSLLAHEVTHVVQQAGGGDPTGNTGPDAGAGGDGSGGGEENGSNGGDSNNSED